MARDVDELWKDPRNWTSRGYHCEEDPRLVVSKRNPAMGWTFNWAHPSASRWFAAILAFALGPSLVLFACVLATGTRDGATIGTLAVGDVIVTIVGSSIVTLLPRRVT